MLKYIFGICMRSILISLSKVSILFQNAHFPILAYFGGHFCYHSNGKSKINIRHLHLTYCCNRSKKEGKDQES